MSQGLLFFNLSRGLHACQRQLDLLDVESDIRMFGRALREADFHIVPETLVHVLSVGREFNGPLVDLRLEAAQRVIEMLELLADILRVFLPGISHDTLGLRRFLTRHEGEERRTGSIRVRNTRRLIRPDPKHRLNGFSREHLNN